MHISTRLITSNPYNYYANHNCHYCLLLFWTAMKLIIIRSNRNSATTSIICPGTVLRIGYHINPWRWLGSSWYQQGHNHYLISAQTPWTSESIHFGKEELRETDTTEYWSRPSCSWFLSHHGSIRCTQPHFWRSSASPNHRKYSSHKAY